MENRWITASFPRRAHAEDRRWHAHYSRIGVTSDAQVQPTGTLHRATQLPWAAAGHPDPWQRHSKAGSVPVIAGQGAVALMNVAAFTGRGGPRPTRIIHRVHERSVVVATLVAAEATSD